MAFFRLNQAIYDKFVQLREVGESNLKYSYVQASQKKRKGVLGWEYKNVYCVFEYILER